MQTQREERARAARKDRVRAAVLLAVISAAAVVTFVLGGRAVAGSSTRAGDLVMVAALVALPAAGFGLWLVARRLWAGDADE